MRMSKEAIFVARIYPIARFIEESPIKFIKKYQSLLEKFLDLNILIGILEGKQEYAEFSLLIDRALELAKHETDTYGGQKAVGKNLASVFSRLSLTDIQKNRSEFYRYRLSELSPMNSFPSPSDKVSEKNQKQLVKKFYIEMDKLSINPPQTYNDFLICFERISQQYMWCFTASDFEGEDISLYDYMKVTEAIMTCLIKCENKEQPYTMVMGDFSGIQKYIFSIASANHHGVAKRLRARSFYVDIVSRVFSQYVVDSFKVGRANILLQTGGKFYCMVPTSGDINQQLQKMRDEFDTYLYKTFHGSVSVNLAWLSCNDNNLIYYSDTIVKLNELLGENKATPFESILKDNDKWDTEAFIICDNLNKKHLCKNCGTELIDLSENRCKMCEMQIEMGRKLPRTKYIVHTRSEKNGSYRIFKDYYIRLMKDYSLKCFEDAYLIEALNSVEIEDHKVAFPIVRKYMANHIPVNEDETKSFDQIAEESSGMSKVAVLKADVDVLGFLFAQGLRTKDRHFGTISRVNTMSRMLEVFFSGYIQQLLEQDPLYQNVYSVFSGGDDLFLIGPWDVMLGLSSIIQKEFKKFVADNNSVTMSATVSIFDSKDHIAFMAEHSELQLDRAKNEPLLEIYPSRTGRNAVCVMGQLFEWSDFDIQMENVKKLRNLLESGIINVGILRRILKYSHMYRQFLINKDAWNLMLEPLFYYDRQRNYNFRQHDKNHENVKWFLDKYIKSMENILDDKIISKNLYFADTVIKIVLNETRRERNG